MRGATSARLQVGLGIAALAASQAQAQVVTDIAPDTAPGFDTGTVVSTSGNETQIGGGELSGTNLFHSFAEFDLGNGDTATWVRGMADANTITNVINRVRSGSASNIDGTLAMADMPNADFWFINPAGVVFGDGASVQVPNAAYFSTAHEIGFAGGQRFSTVTPDGSTFSSAPPQAFGFLGGQANLAILGTFETNSGSAQPTQVNFVAANIGVDALIEGDGTQFNFTAAGSDAAALALPDLAQPSGSGFIEFAPSALVFADGARFVADRIGFNGSQVYGNGSGDLVVRGNEVVLANGAVLQSDTLAGPEGDILVDAGFLLLTTGAAIRTFADPGGAADGGSIHVMADTAIIEAGGNLRAFSDGPGNAGKVGVEGDRLFVDQALITSATAGSGDAGDVAIAAREMAVLPDGTISSEALEFSSGNAGDVTVTVAETLRMELSSEISASSRGSGFAGIVEVKAQRLDMIGGAINSFTGGSSDAGLVGVFVDELNMTGGRIDSASDSVLDNAGNAGSVFIAAGQASIGGWAQIDSRGFAGNAGDVTLEVFGRLEIADMAEISAATDGAGDGGLVQVAADELVMTGGAINSFTGGSGDAGLVDVLARQITMTSGRIDSSSESTVIDAGAAGGVLVRGNDVALSGNAVIESRGVVGDAGDVQLDILGPLSLADDALVSAATDGSGDAGSVFVQADLLAMTGGEINSVTNGSGMAGLVVVDVGELQMTGGLISSASQTPRPLVGLMATSNPMSAGDASAGDAGDVFLRANSAVLDAGASINSISVNSNAGNVTLEVTETLRLRDGGQVSTAAFGGGDAGAIEVAAGTVVLDEFAQITSSAAGDFAAGFIGIAASAIEILDGSEISTNSENGPAGDIALLLPTDGTLRLAGQEVESVITTSSGANSGGRIIISDPYLILAEGSRILALGQQGGANVQIQSAFFIRSSDALNLVSVDGSLLIESNVGEQITGTEVADVPFLDASGILSGQCSGVRQSGEVSQFSSRITGPYAPPSDAIEDEAEESEGDEADRVAMLDRGTLAPCG